jgi:hypothetical protein
MSDCDIGIFSQRTILTGAGWTRNWGGKLAGEIWEDLMSDQGIQTTPSVQSLLLEEPSFEAAIAKVQGESFTQGEREVLERAVLRAFIAMDAEISRTGRNPWINIYKVQEMVFRFWGQRGERVNAGYMFTLNQDLWPERNLFNEHVIGAPAATLPGLRRRPNQRLFTTDLGRYDDHFLMEPILDAAKEVSLHGDFNVIKLHGSFNWRSGSGRNALIMGTEKARQIAKFPLLSWYWDIFRSVLSFGDVRLMIVGYGFADEHVNAVIADAVEKHSLKVFIWDTGPNLMDRIRRAPYGASIWRGVLSTATRPMIEVFPSDQAQTAEYGRILRTMFE